MSACTQAKCLSRRQVLPRVCPPGHKADRTGFLSFFTGAGSLCSQTCRFNNLCPLLPHSL